MYLVNNFFQRVLLFRLEDNASLTRDGAHHENCSSHHTLVHGKVTVRGAFFYIFIFQCLFVLPDATLIEKKTLLILRHSHNSLFHFSLSVNSQ